MNTHAQQWIAALRSGTYKQGIGKLNHNNEQFCCLGVACELFHKELGLEKFVDDPDIVSYDTWTGVLPEQIREHIGLVHVEGRAPNLPALTTLNDTDKIFSEIADILETHESDYFNASEAPEASV